MKSIRRFAAATSAAIIMTAGLAMAQNYAPQAYSPEQLNNLVSRIALYPDPLLAQVLAAATFPDEIADAASFADANRNLNGNDLANAMSAANLPFDPSVQSLIPFPAVLDMMASDMNWTADLGNAVLAQRPDVMDAIQRMRQTASNYGYLANNAQERVVADGGAIEILPVNPDYVYVPVYDPYVVYAAPRPGFFVGGAIRFPFGFRIGAAFGGWGWGGGFYWPSHTVIVHNTVWARTWSNRGGYVQNYGNWNYGRYARTPYDRNAYVNRNVYVNRDVNMNRNVEFNRNVYVNRNVDVNRNVEFNRNVNINRNVDVNRNVEVNRNADYNRNAYMTHSYSENRNSGMNRPAPNPPTFSRPVYNQPSQNFSRPAPSSQPAYQRPVERQAPQEQRSFQPQSRPQPGSFGRGRH